MDEEPDQVRDTASPPAVGRVVAVGTVRALLFGVWALLALLVVVFWIAVCSGSVGDFLSPPTGGRAVDVTPSIGEARESLVDTVILVIVQAVVIAAMVVAVPRVRASHPRHRLPVPGESRSRRWVYTGAVFAGAGLIAAQVFAGPDDPIRPGGLGSDTTARLLAEARALLAGFLEEPFFSMLPVLGLALVPLRWTRGKRAVVWLVVAVVVSACGRAALHMYQGGWPATAAMFWGAATVYAYYRYRSIMGLIVVHTLWNLVAITQFGDSHIDHVILVGFAVLVAGFVVAVTWSGMRTRATDPSPEPDE
ncbi:CPBP family intramembrane glutamic endopeptidase [Nocardia altamirensis]|uniref:CPBP family intramembrane glutamic endopeptidase n=1 Tax=Nocardia altamirensis TaxID=472158 RepID=UPI00083FF45A|nr:CPBP family intramembrane glutamic endopeptidase [Nocardia altamirensis]